MYDLTKKIDNDIIGIDDYWNTSNEKELKIHRIHSYPAKFPAFITTKAIEYAKERGVKIKTISDIFCGCGTTALEARRNNIDFWGCDINPVATLIAKVKSKTYNSEKLNAYFKMIVDKYPQINVSNNEIDHINERIKYWYLQKTIYDLTRLKMSIYYSVPKNSIYLNFFLCAFSNILKPTSLWLTKSIKPQIDRFKNPADVLESFIQQYTMMYQANLENDIKGYSRVEIHTKNILGINFQYSFSDLIVTSPPYVTSYEYADLHQLSSLWLDYAEDYRLLRADNIGSLHNAQYELIKQRLNKTGQDTVNRLLIVDKKKAFATAKYFVDIQSVMKQCFTMLKANGIGLFVIGNTEYNKVKIDNARHLTESLIDAGFKEVLGTKRKISKKILTPFRDPKGRFSSDSNSRKVYSEEFIIIGRKGLIQKN